MTMVNVHRTKMVIDIPVNASDAESFTVAATMIREIAAALKAKGAAVEVKSEFARVRAADAPK